jgi:hypothetical protein
MTSSKTQRMGILTKRPDQGKSTNGWRPTQMIDG